VERDTSFSTSVSTVLAAPGSTGAASVGLRDRLATLDAVCASRSRLMEGRRSTPRSRSAGFEPVDGRWPHERPRV
jgi:hypothetical protein